MLTKKFSLLSTTYLPPHVKSKPFIASEAMPCSQILGMNTKIKNKNNQRIATTIEKKTEKTQKLIMSPNRHCKSHIRDHSLEVPGVGWTKELGLFDLMFHREDIFYIPVNFDSDYEESE